MKKTFAPRISLNNLPFYGIATGAAFAAAPFAANAAVVYNDTPFSILSGTAFWDVDGAENGFEFTIDSNWLLGEGADSNQFVSDGFNCPLPITPGDTVDGAKQFKSYHDYLNFIRDGNIPYAGPYFGFRFTIDGEHHYGWMNVSMTGGENPTLTINNWAYEDQANTAITVIPEPSTTGLALLALGAAGVAAYRQRKAASR